jgi:hypothetical protein
VQQALLVACALLSLAAVPCSGTLPPAQGKLAELLRSSVAGDGLPALLMSLGDERVPEFFTALSELEERRPLDPAGGRAAAAVRAALLQAHRSALLRHLRSMALLPFVEAERRLGVSLLGEGGAPDDVHLLLALAASGAPAPTPGLLRAEFERALLRVLARDPLGLQELPQLVAQAPADLLEGVVAAAGVLGSDAALESLVDALGVRPAADHRLLSEIGRIGAVVTHPVGASVRYRVSRQLAAADALVQVAAMGAVASLGDVDSFPALLEILRREPALAGFADDALRRLSGKSFRGDAAAWEAWYASQVAWWRDRSGGAFDTLASGDAGAAAEALHGLSGQCLFRHELAKGLAPGLRRAEPQLVLLVCSKLGGLGSTSALPDLVALLEHELPELRTAAQRALCQITGRDLPADAAAWRAYEAL